MDVTFVANDTRGGVEPYLALAREAVSRGHTVRAAAPEDYESEFSAAGVRYTPLRGVDRAAIAARSDQVSLRQMSRHVTELSRVWAREVRELADGSDVLVAGIGGLATAGPVAEALGVPLLRAHLQPLEAPSWSYPGALAPQLDRLGPLGRRLSHALTGAGTALLTRAPEKAAREALGLPRRSRAPLPSILYGFSPAVVPVRSDARTTRIATGYWRLAAPSDEAVPSDLREFVSASDPIVSFGFGSMTADDSARLFEAVVDAVERVGVRAVLLTGWGGLAGGESSERVHVAASVPHSWLFPRMAATIHHGGAGTTGAALAAGVPTLIVPFGADQLFWGRRAEALGASPAPLPRKRLDADRLSAALERMLRDGAMRERAASLGETLRAERGASGAIDHVESAVTARPGRDRRPRSTG
ncbi:glycosyltransferase [Microbacterium sp. BK668]|uniref:glycosyltransferase n=1 Tax=Microbacterium sp. BK668 TaxID=2512118 RepID=UPI00105BEF25|nr:glycosyltransferase [Microbacterium sp. BK668]